MINKILLIVLTLMISATHAETVYLSPEQFIDHHFSETPDSQYFWLTPPHKSKVTEILGHRPSKIRIKYWGKNNKTVWVLEEIGKEQPITVGIAVENSKIDELKVLIYRESRGYEVKQTFFTDQYIGSGIDQDMNLENTIDGITGATLSVRALNKLARVALYLHQNSPFKDHNEKTTASP